jgi:hypothetical protein
MGELLDAALREAEQLRPVFVLSSSKRPVANCRACAGGDHHGETCDHLMCHGHLAATCDPERIKAMFRLAPRGMLAGRTGVVAGLVVVDVDPRNGGEESMSALKERGLLPPTRCVATGSDGWHLYYRHPGGRVPSRPLPGFGGIDVKGDGGYVVLPPSLHPDTKRPYRWVGGHGLSEMHPALLSACTAVPAACAPFVPRSGAPLRGSPGARVTAPDRLLAAILDRVRQAPEGQRRRTLYGCARGVARLVAAGSLTATDAVAELVDVARTAGGAGKHRLTDAQIRNAIAGGFHDEGVAV